jgi:hypothetical protein
MAQACCVWQLCWLLLLLVVVLLDSTVGGSG